MPVTPVFGWPYQHRLEQPGLNPEAIEALAKAIEATVSPLLGPLGRAWDVPWAPSWTNFTPGNAVISARALMFGKTLLGRLKVIVGTTSSFSGNPVFTLPAALHATYVLDDLLAYGQALDAAVNSYTISVYANGGNAARFSITGTAPFTFGNGDSFLVTFLAETT